MRPDPGAQRQKERHDRQPVILTGAVEVAVQHPIGKHRELAVLEIHQQEGEVVEDVDAGQRLGELQAVEQGRLAVEQANVAEVQIAMAMAHLAGRAPPVEQRGERRQPIVPLLADRCDALRGKAGMLRGREAAILRLGEVRHLRGAAAIEVPFGRAVKQARRDRRARR